MGDGAARHDTVLRREPSKQKNVFNRNRKIWALPTLLVLRVFLKTSMVLMRVSMESLAQANANKQLMVVSLALSSWSWSHWTNNVSMESNCCLGPLTLKGLRFCRKTNNNCTIWFRNPGSDLDWDSINGKSSRVVKSASVYSFLHSSTILLILLTDLPTFLAACCALQIPFKACCR